MILRTTIGAFVLSQETADAIEALREERLFLRSTLVVEQGGMKAALARLSESGAPPVLIVETAARGEALHEELNQLANLCEAGTRVFLVGHENDIRLFRDLIREGLSDYLVAPVTADMIRDSFLQVFEGSKDAEKRGRVIAFYAVRGGAGSSILSHHTAYALSQIFETQVIVVDLDIPFGTAALTFNVQPRQTIVDVLSQTNRLDDVLLNRHLIEFDKKLSVLASPSALGTGVMVGVEMLSEFMKVIKTLADFIVLDVPHTWDPWVREVLVETDDLVIVAEPDLGSLRDAKNLVEFLSPARSAEVPTNVVLNKVGVPKRPELSDKEFNDALAIKPKLHVPADVAAFGLALNNGELVFKAAAKSKACEAINELAKLVSGREVIPEKKKKGFSLFKK